MAESHVGTSSRRIYAAVTPVDETPSLSAFGEPIPPSRVEAMAKEIGIPKPDSDADPETINSYESATWEYLRQVIDKLVERADSTNLKSVLAQLFAENIVRGRGMLVSACMRCQSKNPHLTPVYAALVGLVKKYFPSVGDLLYKRLFFTLSQMLTGGYDEDEMNVKTKFLAQLVNLKIFYIHDSIQLILCCLIPETEERVKLAVTLFQELKLPGCAFYFEGVKGHFRRIIKEKKLKKEIHDMATSVVARRNWSSVFKNDPILPSELQWVISALEPVIRLCQSTKPATNRDIFFGDVYRSDKYFLKRERAYYLFMSMTLHDDDWFEILPEEEGLFSDYDEVVRKHETEDQQSCFGQLLPKIIHEDEIKVCLGIFRYMCLGKKPFSLVLLIELLCKRGDKRYKEALETCFLVVWLMVAYESPFAEAVEAFAELLCKGYLSWDVVAHMPLEPQYMTKGQYIFLRDLFMLCSYTFDPKYVSENLCRCCPCVPAAVMFFRVIDLPEVADDLEERWKA